MVEIIWFGVAQLLQGLGNCKVPCPKVEALISFALKFCRGILKQAVHIVNPQISYNWRNLAWRSRQKFQRQRLVSIYTKLLQEVICSKGTIAAFWCQGCTYLFHITPLYPLYFYSKKIKNFFFWWSYTSCLAIDTI